MRPNMDAEIVVLQSILANAKDQHQLKAGLSHAVELLDEVTAYAVPLAQALRLARGAMMDAVSVLPLVEHREVIAPLSRAIRAADAALAKNPNPSGQSLAEPSPASGGDADPAVTNEDSGPVGLGPHEPHQMKPSLVDPIPTSWLDPLLSEMGLGPFSCQDVERLLRRIRERVAGNERHEIKSHQGEGK